MYDAVVRRDEGLRGVFVVAVKTTGVFCVPGCFARTPRRENVEFFDTSAEALRAGYRPCRRCRPMEPADLAPPWVAQLLELVERTLDRRLTAADFRAVGIQPARAARYFKSRFGMTFQAYHRARRMGDAVRLLRAGTSVTDAASRTGFDSAAGFRDAFTRLFGAPPTGKPAARTLFVKWMESPLGPLVAMADDQGVVLLEFSDRRALFAQLQTVARRFDAPVVCASNRLLEDLARQMHDYFAGTIKRFTTPLSVRGTPFQEAVWAALRDIPPGETRSYAQIAAAIGRPTATRAVARANGDNRLAILIPCHRVIGSDSSLTGYGGGLWRKQWLLDHERGPLTLWPSTTPAPASRRPSEPPGSPRHISTSRPPIPKIKKASATLLT